MSKPRLQDVLETLRHAIDLVISPLFPIAGTPSVDNPSPAPIADGSVSIGWPNPDVLGSMMNDNRVIVSLFPTARSKDVSRFPNEIAIVPQSDGSLVSIQTVGRTNRDIQVSVWSPDPNVRQILAETIYARIGTPGNRFVTLSDGTMLTVNRSTTSWIDDAQSKYTTYIAHLVLTCEYDDVIVLTATRVTSADALLTVGPITELLTSPSGEPS